MTREQMVVELLRTLELARQEDQNGPQGRRGAATSKVLDFSRLYRTGSYHQLEKQLDLMKVSEETYNDIVLARLYWHIAERYLRCDRRSFPARKRGRSPIEVEINGWWAWGDGERRQVVGGNVSYGFVTVERWSRKVNLAFVSDGVKWLAETIPGQIMLPPDLYGKMSA